MAPALQQAVDAGIPVVTIDRRVDNVPGILAHVGADNVKGGEAQGELIMKLFPDGATIINLLGSPGASPAIDRAKGLHNILDAHADKYKFVFEQTANFNRADGLSVTESALGGMDGPPDVIVAGNDDMALGAIEALKARNYEGVTVIGFDALPEALVAVRDGSLTATVEQFPGGQSRGAVQALVKFLREGVEAGAAGPADADRHHQGQYRRSRAYRRSAVGDAGTAAAADGPPRAVSSTRPRRYSADD